MKMIKFSEVSSKRISLAEVSDFLRQNLSSDILLNYNQRDIVFNCLTLFNFRNVVNSEDSVAFYAEKVINALGFSSGGVDVVKFFYNVVLKLKGVPVFYKNILENEARIDLVNVNALLNYYKGLPFIKEHIKSNAQPRDQLEGAILIFYHRTLKKYDDIINYMLYSVDEIALEAARSQQESEFLVEDKPVLKQLEIHRLFPYKDYVYNRFIECKIDFEKLDYRKINIFRNKMFVDVVGPHVDKGLSVDDLNKLLIKTKPDYYFKYILDTSDFLPIIGRRKGIFEELKFLFLKKKWYGFYALALPQVEGVFADMLKIIAPSKGVKGALPGKVEAVRSSYSLSDKFFDYYQYYLPIQRNKFSHTGYEDDIKVKSYHMLIDLWYVVYTFIELESPLLELVRAMKKGGSYFEDIGRLSRYTTLVKELSNKKAFQDKEHDIRKFIVDFLVLKINASDLLKNLQHDFDVAYKEFDNKFLMTSSVHAKKEIFFSELTKSEMISMKDELCDLFSDGFSVLYQNEIKLLVDTNNFIRNIADRSYGIPGGIQSLFNDFFITNKPLLDKLDVLGPGKKISFDINESFYTYLNPQLTHKDVLSK